MSVDQTVVIVTGASKGLGFELCRRLYQDGAAVVGIARDINTLSDAQAQWHCDTDNAGQLMAVSVDATDETAVNGVVAAAVERFGHLDILINNVGGLPQTGQFQDLSRSDWQHCFDLNVMSVVNFCQAVYPFLKQSERARIVNMTSITALEPGVFNPHYSSCKAAVLNLTKHLASVWAADNILVNSIAAGPFDSPSIQNVIADKASAQGRELADVKREFICGLTDKIPLGRLGCVEDVAALTLFLVSEQATWITGTNICIDGGKHRGIL